MKTSAEARVAEKPALPSTFDPLLTLSATELAAMLRARKIRSRDLVDLHIERIRAVNPRLNAMVVNRFALAKIEADAADRRFDSEPAATLPALLGVPFTVKESFALAGMPNCAGLWSRRLHRATVADQGAALNRLLASGAIPLGVTNVSELCMWVESRNVVYGQTSNAYNEAHIAGGSSGGEGAIIGAGGSPFGLAADVGGSIRMPSFFNGVFGHKPSGGLVPNTGQFPSAHGTAMSILTTGPIARRAEDLWPLLKLMAGPDGVDAECRNYPLGDPATVDLSKLRVLVVEDNGFITPSDDMKGALRRAADALARQGARVETTVIPELAWSFDIWSSMLLEANGATFGEELGDGHRKAIVPELARWMLGCSVHTLPSLLLALIERASPLLDWRSRHYAQRGRHLRHELAVRLGPDGVLLIPPYPQTAPKHGMPLLRPFDWVYCGLFNVMRMPATAVPMGLDGNGLPLGIQVVGVHGNDRRTIRVAQELEKSCGGWIPPIEQ